MIRETVPNFLTQMQVYASPVSQIAAIGIELPTREVDNQELVELLDAPPEVKTRLVKLVDRMTGIKTRRYAAPTTSPSDLACLAAKKAAKNAGIAMAQIDTLIFAATDMDMIEPSTANIIQQKLGIPAVNAFDVSNACNSFLQAMNVANSLLATGAANRVLIASGETPSQVVNRRLEAIRELDVKLGGLTLGDAGAALIMERANGEAGLLEVNLISLGQYWEVCHIPEQIHWRHSPKPTIYGWFYLDMPKLAKIAREATVGYFKDYMAYRRKTFGEYAFLESLAQVFPHQISRRFIEDIGKAVATETQAVDFSKLCITADIYGNTASTSIPLAIAKLMDDGIISLGSGQEILLYGAASGFGIGHIRLRL